MTSNTCTTTRIGLRWSLAAASMLVPCLLIGQAEAQTAARRANPAEVNTKAAPPAGTEGGWEGARDSLAAAVRGNPGDLRAQLAYAEILVQRDGARADGLNRLALLARDPAVSDKATQAWRRAVLSLPQSQAAVPMLAAFLSVRPDDGEVAARLAAVSTPPPAVRDVSASQRAAQAAVAEHLKATPNDPKAWMASADLARASGNPTRALHDLTRARELRMQQLGDSGSDDSTVTRVTLAPGDDPIATHGLPQVKVSQPGSNMAPSSATYVYANVANANVDRGDDAPSPLAVPPGLSARGRPTPLSPTPLSPTPLSPTPLSPTPLAPSVSASNAASTGNLQAETLPPPQTAPSASGGTTTTDQLNRLQLYTLRYGSLQPQPSYAAPGDAAPSYPTPPAYPGSQYGQAQDASPSYQPQLQGYLPRYRPALAASDQAGADDVQSIGNGDLNPAFPVAAPGGAPGAAQQFASNDDSLAGRSLADLASPVEIGNNPFRGSTNDGSSGFGTGGRGGVYDPLTQQIDRDIVQLRDALAPSFQAGFGVRTSSGTTGFAKVTELNTPIEATYPTGGSGEIKLSVVPTALISGSIGGDSNTLQRFGSVALGLTGPRPGSQDAQGVGLDVGYKNRLVTADIGSSPLGFLVPNVVGGIEFTPELADGVQLDVGFERRSLTDSVLAYAGTTDPRTGTKWGGVVRNQGKVGLGFSAGQAAFYVNAGGGQLTGQHVADNTDVTVGAGGSYPVYRKGSDEVRVGLNLLFLSYEKNLSFFTLGQGGYFSPQSYFSALVPVTYTGKLNENLNFEVGAALGYQVYHQKSSNFYPADPALQAQLKGTGLTGVYPGQNTSDVAGNAHGKLEYRVSPALRLGAQASYQHAGTYDEVEAGLYARYQFNGTDK